MNLKFEQQKNSTRLSGADVLPAYEPANFYEKLEDESDTKAEVNIEASRVDCVAVAVAVFVGS